jgi:hypothetical protein
MGDHRVCGQSLERSNPEVQYAYTGITTCSCGHELLFWLYYLDWVDNPKHLTAPCAISPGKEYYLKGTYQASCHSSCIEASLHLIRGSHRQVDVYVAQCTRPVTRQINYHLRVNRRLI